MRLALILIAVSVMLVLAIPPSNPGKHHGHPSPTPTPTPSPIPKITLAWNPSLSATGYHLKTGFSSGAENTSTDVGNVTTWTLQLSPATTYYFVVTAYNSTGESAPSNEVAYTTP